VVHTEIRRSGKTIKYYRVLTFRKKGKVVHLRKYLGSGLKHAELKRKEQDADLLLKHPLNTLLSSNERLLLEHIKAQHKSKSPSTLENRYEAFVSEFTYDSTGIEGNTLTLRETAAVLFEGATPAKTLREIYEVLNHKKAFDYLLSYKSDFSKNLLCALQTIVTENTLKPEVAKQAGVYRTVPVFIRGAKISPPPPEQVHKEMRSLLSWYSKNKHSLHPVVLAGYVHAAFEAIHPFIDGNGRTGRLVINFLLHKNNYPMISIHRTQRMRYLKTLAQAQNGNLRPFIVLLIQLLKQTEKSV